LTKQKAKDPTYPNSFRDTLFLFWWQSMSLEQEVKNFVREVVSQQTEVPEDPAPPPGVSDEEIEGFIQRTGLVPPEALRQWLQFSNAPRMGPGFMQGIRPPHGDDYDIEQSLKFYPDWGEKGWIPVATDGFGNYYVLATTPDYGPGNPFFFIDTMADSTKPTYVVASDLWHFLWFLFRCDRWWPFDKKKVLKKDPFLKNPYPVPRPWEVDS
jgi:hypothetical protein